MKYSRMSNKYFTISFQHKNINTIKLLNNYKIPFDFIHPVTIQPTQF